MNRKEAILNIIKSHFPDIDLKLRLLTIDEGKIHIKKSSHRDKNPFINHFSKHLEETYFARLDTPFLYHYLPTCYLSSIIRGKLRLYNLDKYIKTNQDSKEYYYFIEKMELLNPKDKDPLQKANDIFILSCTYEKDSPEHWNYYSNDKNNNGACICFKVDTKKLNSITDIRRVVYEAELIKLFCLIRCIKEQFNLALIVPNFTLFTKFFKRSYYDWEKEVRICFDSNSNKIQRVMMNFPANIKNPNINKQTDEDKYFSLIEKDEMNHKYIEVELKDFNIQIESIQLKSPNAKIEEICKQKGIELILKDTLLQA